MPVRLTAMRAFLLGISLIAALLWDEKGVFADSHPAGGDEVLAATASDSRNAKKKKRKNNAGQRALQNRPEQQIPVPYRDTVIGYRNVVSVRSFRKDRDLTYNPYYAMELDLTPTWWVGPHTYLALDIALSRQFTNSYDVFAYETTKRGETLLWDIFLEVGVPRLIKIPRVDIEVRPTFRLVVPTSKGARARTMILGLRPAVMLVKHFNVFHRLSWFWEIWFRKDFHSYTTSETEAPLISDPMGSTRSVESFMNIGIRNVSHGLSNQLGFKLALTRSMGMMLRVYIVHQFLYDLEHKDERISYEPQKSSEIRYLMRYTGEIYYIPKKLRPLTVALGFLTENPQLRRDSSYETPFFNRYTAIFLDLRLNIAGLSSRLASKRGRL